MTKRNQHQRISEAFSHILNMFLLFCILNMRDFVQFHAPLIDDVLKIKTEKKEVKKNVEVEEKKINELKFFFFH